MFYLELFLRLMPRSHKYSSKRAVLPALRFSGEGSPPEATTVSHPRLWQRQKHPLWQKTPQVAAFASPTENVKGRSVYPLMETRMTEPRQQLNFSLMIVMTGICSGSIQYSLPLLLFISPREYSLEIIKLPIIPKVLLTGILSPTFRCL